MPTGIAAAAFFLMAMLAACSSVTEPVPVSTFDGVYVGSRHSNDAAACGIEAPAGKSSASVSRGRLSVELFSSGTRMVGTVGEDGTLRASGFWPAPHSFAAITVLKGKITGTVLAGSASNFRCTTEITLARQGRVRKPVPVR